MENKEIKEEAGVVEKKANLLIECLSSGSKISSKRVATFVALLTWVTCIITELYTKFEVSPNTMDAMMYIVGFGIGATASEKFTSKK
jgi:hypothetical protein